MKRGRGGSKGSSGSSGTAFSGAALLAYRGGYLSYLKMLAVENVERLWVDRERFEVKPDHNYVLEVVFRELPPMTREG